MVGISVKKFSPRNRIIGKDLFECPNFLIGLANFR
jgi:hypothetical protein